MYKIKRPVAVIGFTFFISGSIALSMPKGYSAVLLALFALFTFIHYKTRTVYTKHLAVMLVSAVVSVAYINVFGVFWQNNIDTIPKDTAEYTGYVSKINNSENTSYTVTILDSKNREDYKITLYYHDGFALGDVLSITGKFKPARNNRYVFSSYADNILGTISADEIVLKDIKPSSVDYIAVKAKKRILESMDKLYSKDVLAVASAISYNDKHLISSDIKEDFKVAGMSHTLVVSGLHVWIVVAAVMGLLKYIPINKKTKNVMALVVLVAFMQVAGLSASVTRAGLLVCIVLLAKNFGKDQDSITSLALIGMLCVINNPYITRDIGAMMSYAASVGLVLTNTECRKRNITGYKRDLLCAAMAVVFTMPVMAMADMQVTVLSPIFNLLFTPLISVICILSVSTPIVNLIPFVKYAAVPFASLNKLFINSLLAILDFTATYSEFALINLSHPVFVTVIFAALAAYFVAYFQTDNTAKRKIFVTAVSIMAFLCYNLLNWNTVTVRAFDSGRECSFHISARGGEYLVLSEDMDVPKAKQQLVAVNARRFDGIYYCPKNTESYISLDEITDEFVIVDKTGEYSNNLFTLKSETAKNSKLFTVTVADCDISFGHGKVTSSGNEYYFLGNDKPKEVTAGEIYLFGNIPQWMNVEDIYTVDSDITIKINLKTGNYKTTEDVFNFG